MALFGSHFRIINFIENLSIASSIKFSGLIVFEAYSGIKVSKVVSFQ